jgi:hypothetical protein
MKLTASAGLDIGKAGFGFVGINWQPSAGLPVCGVQRSKFRPCKLVYRVIGQAFALPVVYRYSGPAKVG